MIKKKNILQGRNLKLIFNIFSKIIRIEKTKANNKKLNHFFSLLSKLNV